MLKVHLLIALLTSASTFAAPKTNPTTVEAVKKMVTAMQKAKGSKNYMKIMSGYVTPSEKLYLINNKVFEQIPSSYSLLAQSENLILNMEGKTIQIQVVDLQNGQYMLNGKPWKFDRLLTPETSLQQIKQALTKTKVSLLDMAFPEAYAEPLTAGAIAGSIYALGWLGYTIACSIQLGERQHDPDAFQRGLGVALCGFASIAWPLHTLGFLINEASAKEQPKVTSLTCPQDNNGKMEMRASDGSRLSFTPSGKEGVVVAHNPNAKESKFKDIELKINKDWQIFDARNANKEKFIIGKDSGDAQMSRVKDYLTACSDPERLQKLRADITHTTTTPTTGTVSP